MFTGHAFLLQPLHDNFWELVLDLQGSSVNKFNALTLHELREVLSILSQNQADIAGLLLRSAKTNFVVGADINEFAGIFARPAPQIVQWVSDCQQLFLRLENLNFPSVSTIRGMALGGGLELALATDYRILAETGKVGLPEISLGLCPGWGGTVRLTRLVGAETALEWMLSGKPHSATQALAAGAVDEVVAEADLPTRALAWLQQAAATYPALRARKCQPVSLTAPLAPRFTRYCQPNYPAAEAILALVSRQHNLPLTEALQAETQTFVELGQSATANALLGLFINEQQVKRKARNWQQRAALNIQHSAVLGAGIMGGGIAYQSAVSNIPVVMKDIREPALELGMQTARQLLDRQIAKGQLDEAGKAAVLARIQPTLDYAPLQQVDLVVEAVVENPQIKAAVLREVEAQVSAQTIQHLYPFH